MKRVLLFSHLAYPDRMSGAEKSLLLLARILVRHHFNVKVISPEQGVLTRELAGWGIKTEIVTFRGCFWEMMAPGPGFESRLNQAKGADRLGMAHLSRAIVDFRPDYAVINTVVNVLPASVARTMGIRVIWFIREPIEDAPCQKEAGLLVGRLADMIVVNSRAVARMFRSCNLGSKLLYLPNAIDPGELDEEKWPRFRHAVRNRLGIGDSEVLVGFVGALVPDKGADEFVRMAGVVGQKVPGTAFCLAGAGRAGELSQLEQMAKEQTKGVRVHFLGYWPEINSLLPALDVVVLPSTVAEGCPRAALEAMAFQKPVVAYRVGGMEDLIRHNQTGYLAPLKNRDELACSVEKLAGSPVLRAQFGLEARRVVEAVYHVKEYQKKLRAVFV